MEIHINLEFVESIDELKATIDELKDMEYLGTKIFVNVEHLKKDPSAGTDEPRDIGTSYLGKDYKRIVIEAKGEKPRPVASISRDVILTDDKHNTKIERFD